MNVERLELLKTLLDEIEENKRLRESFSLSDWVDVDLIEVAEDEDDEECDPDVLISAKVDRVIANLSEDNLLQSIPECGTTACACGYAGLDLRFRSQGFRTDVAFGDVTYEEKFGWNAITHFFEISEEIANNLFMTNFYSSYNNGPAAVANRIRILLDQGEVAMWGDIEQHCNLQGCEENE